MELDNKILFETSKWNKTLLGGICDISSGFYSTFASTFILDNITYSVERATGFSKILEENITIEPKNIVALIDLEDVQGYRCDCSIKAKRGIFLNKPQYTEDRKSYLVKCANRRFATVKGNIVTYQPLVSKKLEMALSEKLLLTFEGYESRCMHDKSVHFAYPSGAYGIKIHTPSNTYTLPLLLALFNSRLFPVLRKHLEEEKFSTSRYGKFKSLTNFPLPDAIDVKKKTVIENLACLMSISSKYELSKYNDSLSDRMESYLREVLDMAIYELYYGEYMKKRGIDIIDYLIDLPWLDSAKASPNSLTAFYNWMLSPNNSVRQKIQLLDTRSPELLYPIHNQLHL